MKNTKPQKKIEAPKAVANMPGEKELASAAKNAIRPKSTKQKYDANSLYMGYTDEFE